MSQSCCPNPAFERHLDPEIADIGSADGIEFTIGQCTACGRAVMHCWIAHLFGKELPVDQDFIDLVAASADYQERQRLLGRWAVAHGLG